MSNLITDSEEYGESFPLVNSDNDRLNPAVITSVDLNVNGVCNLECVWCWGPEHNPAIETLTDSDWMNLMDTLTVQGLKEVIFTGGEPLLKTGLVNLASHAKKLNLRTTLSTNGILLPQKPEVLEFIDDLGIPLDASTPELNAIMRTRVGKSDKRPHFYSAISALKLVQKTFPGIDLTVRTVVSNKNMDSVKQIPETLRGFGVNTDSLRWKLYQLNPVGIRTEASLKGEWTITHENFNRVICEVRDQHEDSFREIKEQFASTSIGRYVFIEPDGKVWVTISSTTSDDRVVGEHMLVGNVEADGIEKIIENIVAGKLISSQRLGGAIQTPVQIGSRRGN
jgi:MoaA/NifB/PqqE/SkfB family radical SAM enzyme